MVDQHLTPFLDSPNESGFFCDFDGTLAPIVPVPSDARPLTGAPEALASLADRLALVAVLSGRPLEYLERWFAPSVTLAGLYGLEVRRDGVRESHPLCGSWREVIDDVAATSTARGPSGMRVEPKGVSLTLHYREHPELADAVARWATEQAARSGLVVRSARMSYELHPPIDVDKSTALLALAEGLAVVCFVGDDVGDLPAFDALDELAATGVHTVRIAVRSDEASPDLLGRADVVLDGPPAVLALLTSLR